MTLGKKREKTLLEINGLGNSGLGLIVSVFGGVSFVFVD